MKKIKQLLSICFLAVFLFPISAEAQLSFNHSLGPGIAYGGDAYSYLITYSPRLNFVQMGDVASLSLGTHLGGGISYNSRAGAAYVGADLPLVLELNLGHANNPDADGRFGGFVGGGFSFCYLGSQSDFGGSENIAWGPYFNGGFRFSVMERSLGIRGFFLLNMNEGYGSAGGAEVFFTFGM